MASKQKKESCERTIFEKGKQIKAFVLTEGDQNIVYVPYRACMAPDYKLLRDMTKIADRKGEDLLETLRDNKAENGKNALSQIENLITYTPIDTGKTSNVVMTESAAKEDFTNPIAEEVPEESKTESAASPTKSTPSSTPSTSKKKPGRPPKHTSTTSSSFGGEDSA